MIQTYRIIKNKILNIKIIFKNIKNILRFQTYFFYFIKHYKIISKNYSQKLFLKVILKIKQALPGLL